MVLKYIEKSRNEADLSSLRSIEHAAELYYASGMNGADYNKTIYFPDEDNVLGLKGTKPEDGMVSISDSGKIKVIATIHGKTYISEGSGLFGTNHYFKAIGSITAPDSEWEYEKINDTDVRLTKYKGYKYHLKDEFNDLNIISEETYKEIKQEMDRNNTLVEEEQIQMYLSITLYNISFPINERKTLDEMFELAGADEETLNSIEPSVKTEGTFFFDLVKSHFSDKYENGVNMDDETEMAKFEQEVMTLIKNNKSKLPRIYKIMFSSNEEDGIKYLSVFIFPARLKTSDGIYNVTEIGNGVIQSNGDCVKRSYSIFEDVSYYLSCYGGRGYINKVDKIIVPDGIKSINNHALLYIDTKELSLPNTLKELNTVTDIIGTTASLRSLQELKIPSSVELINSNFINRSQVNLKRIIFEGTEDGTSKLKGIKANAFTIYENLGDMTIYVPNSVTEIYSNSFNSSYSASTTTNLNIIIKKDDCSSLGLVDSPNVKYTCQS